MIRSPASRARRAGFTLVEVLVVIAIIAVLVSLTAAAVFKISGQADILVARNDMSNLAAAVEAFKTQMKVDWLPSRFRLREDLYGYINGINTGDYLDAESWSYLKKLFPKIQTPTAAYPNPGFVWIDWNLTGGTPDAAVDLEGHQCLVFFLGGIPSYSPNSVTGFSTNPSNPASPGGERIVPFFRDFRSNRLAIIPTPPLSTSISVANSSYFSYLDAWDQNPYAYFSAYKKINGYNRYYGYYQALGLTYASGAMWSDNHTLQVEDRTTLTTGIGDVWPYAQSGGSVASPLAVYQNKDTYQIICSGPDKVFGQGTPMVVTAGVWIPTPANSVWSPQVASYQTPKGRDDYSNFHDRQMGSGD